MWSRLNFLSSVGFGIATIALYLLILVLALLFPDQAHSSWLQAGHGLAAFLLAVAICSCLARRYREWPGSEPDRELPPAVRLKRLGSVIFHLGIVLLLPVGWLDSTLSFEGQMVLTRSVESRENHQSYLQTSEGPLFLEGHRNFTIKLQDYLTRIEHGMATSVASILELGDRENKTVHHVRPNHPAFHEDCKFVLKDWGPALYMKVETTNHRPVLDSIVNLDLLYGRTDSIEIKDFNQVLTFRMLTSREEHNCLITPQRNDLIYSRFHLNIIQNGHEVYDGPFSLASPVFTQGLHYRILKIVPWNRFLVTYHPLRRMIFTLMTITLVALALCLLSPLVLSSPGPTDNRKEVDH